MPKDATVEHYQNRKLDSEESLKKKRGWIKARGDYYLTRGAIVREFKITKEEFNHMLQTYWGAMSRYPFYPRMHSSFVEYVFSFNDVQLLMQKLHLGKYCIS